VDFFDAVFFYLTINEIDDGGGSEAATSAADSKPLTIPCLQFRNQYSSRKDAVHGQNPLLF
jgi:hypothetical protein